MCDGVIVEPLASPSRVRVPLHELGRQKTDINIEVWSDSDSFVSSVIKDGKVKCTRLRIGVVAIRQEIILGLGISLRWVPARAMLVDALTEAMATVALAIAMMSRKHTFRPAAQEEAFVRDADGHYVQLVNGRVSF